MVLPNQGGNWGTIRGGHLQDRDSQRPFAPSTTMEPLHITEFASKRYFDKINQHPKDQQPQQQQQQQNDGSLVEASPSRFILPIRQVEKQGHDGPQAKHVDHIKAEKEREGERRRLFGLGRLRPSKSSVLAPEPHTPQNPRRPSLASVVLTSSVVEGSGVKPKRYGYTTHTILYVTVR